LSNRSTSQKVVESGTFHEAVAKYERDLIERTIEEAGGNKSEAARRLKISIRTLYNKLDTTQ
ncbi:MAG: helix-turn-helix domain-containing protein, partial [Exiguobacterium marinum]